jgi:catechol 2,3-dioxygenase-like lactoylglutathione lyase family enzyme
MLDHVFLSVSDIARSIDFYTAALTPLGVTTRVDYDGKDGPPGHPDLKGFGADGHIFFWLRHGVVDTVNGYTFTPMAAAEAARRVLAGEHQPGFRTPAALFGNGFAETIADTRISDF